MSRNSLCWKTEIWGLLLILLVSAGCASGDIGEPAAECTGDEDCAPEEFCNVVSGTCSRVVNPNNANNQPDIGDPGDLSNPNNQNNQSDMQQEPDLAPDMNDEPDMSTVTCDPECGPGQTCDPNGMCVDGCMPACETPEVCTAQGCRIPDCRAAGDACDLNKQDQGGFLCLSASGQGRCFARCDEAFSASTCSTGEYCLNVGSSASPVNVCIESDCADHPDCSQGSCVLFDNQFGACFESGPTGEGMSCVVSNNECEEGTLCRRLAPGSDNGICAKICDFWATSSDCPSGQACGIVYTSRTGLCTSDVTGPGTTQFSSCTSQGDFCGDGLLCLRGNATDNFCFGYCRPSGNDCTTQLPSGADAACNNAVFPGDDTIGICDPACDPAEMNPCGVGAVCVDNGFGDFICRSTCTPGNEVDDCCDGRTPCNYTCNSDMLCE